MAIDKASLDSLRIERGTTDARERKPLWIAIGVGVLNLLLGEPKPDAGAWLVTGTVTADTLQRAIAALPPTNGFRR